MDFKQVWLSNFKSIFCILLVLCVFNACQDIPRDNVLDPKNSASQRPQIVAVEAFVNTNNEFEYNQYMLEAVDLLAAKYPNKLTVVQYHRNAGSIEDPFHLAVNEFLYEKYIAALQTGDKGVPDVFMNGIATRIQGASSTSGALFRLEEAIQPLLVENSYFTIEAEVKRNNSDVAISCRIARLGSAEINDILVKAIVVEKVDNLVHKRVVRAILKSNVISKFSPGEIKEIKFDKYSEISNSDLKVILSITSEDELQIYQSEEVEVS